MPRWGFIGLALAASLALTGCGPNTNYKYQVLVIPKGLTHEHWQSVHRGAERAAADLSARGISVEVLWQGPQTESNAQDQIDLIDRGIGRKVSGIVLAPQDSKQMVDPVQRAHNEDIPTVIIDSNLDKKALDANPDLTVKYVATENKHGGRLAAERLLTVLADRGNESPRLVLFRYAPGSESTEQREDGFLEYVNERIDKQKKAGKPAPIVIDANTYAGSTVESAEKAAGPMLGRLREEGIDGIFAVNESSATGLLNALRSADLNKKVHVVAFDISAPLRRALEEGELDGTVVQDPYRMGYLGLWFVVQHLEGYDAASDGQKDVSTGEYLVTKENLKSKDIEGLFNPDLQKQRTIETPTLKKKELTVSDGPRLTMIGIRKRFGPTEALRGVDLTLRAGEVHALVGENGAGKSTLMKVLSGTVVPDAGTMQLEGRPYAPTGPHDARRRGVAMIYQELALAPHLSVEANIMLGVEASRFGFLRGGLHRRRVSDALAVLHHSEIHPDTPVSHLGPGACQLVEIARALVVDVRVLVLDEPTSSLTQEDAGHLFDLVRRLRERGVTIVYISHFLEEVQGVADRLTVLRDGESAGGGAVGEFSRERIIELMVGRRLTEQFPRVPHTLGEPILELADLCGIDLPRGANLTLHRGEILGIAGIVGAGRTEMLRAVFGLDPVRSGQVKLQAVDSLRATPSRRIRQGLGLLSEDRKGEGLALTRSIADNLTYSRLSPYGRFGWLNLRRRARAVADWLSRLGVRCAGPEQPVGELSGGNQQKVALGRLLHQEADVLLLDEPTRGVDVGSKAEIYRLIGELAARGKAVLFVSSYLPELLGVCDRLAVMVRGRLTPARPVADWTPEAVMASATGSEVVA